MAYEMDVLDVSLLAAADLSGYQYRFVKLTADNTVNVCGAGEQAIGVLQNKPTGAGQAARVRVLGVSRVVAGGSVTYGQKLGTDANGAGVAKTADKAIYLGIVIDGVGSGETITALIMGVPNTISTT